MFSTVGTLVAFAAFLGTSMTLAADAPVLGDGEIRLWIVLGSIAGAILAISFNRPATRFDAFVKWVGSTLAAFALTPWILYRMFAGGGLVAEEALGVSFVVAFLAWVLLRTLQKIAPRLLERRLGAEDSPRFPHEK